ncbi:hypothetical protein [Lactococcus lactis]|uniref:hypothetical protein n=1 Tax=Lactococcus lactis TaxID=1358 RepID=UPI0015C34813|nr:hypothetical protein [Lactococcus lactis]QLF89381.1 hypothetical protein HPC60_01040 [Lactococcus lactis subsp. lactis]
MPTEFMGILLEYFLDEPTGASPQFLEEYSKETKAEFLIRFKKTLDEKQEQEINLEQIELEMKVFNFIKKQSESFLMNLLKNKKYYLLLLNKIKYSPFPKRRLKSLKKKKKLKPKKLKSKMRQTIKKHFKLKKIFNFLMGFSKIPPSPAYFQLKN